jgi:hypothetical protein
MVVVDGAVTLTNDTAAASADALRANRLLQA